MIEEEFWVCMCVHTYVCVGGADEHISSGIRRYQEVDLGKGSQRLPLSSCRCSFCMGGRLSRADG